MSIPSAARPAIAAGDPLGTLPWMAATLAAESAHGNGWLGRGTDANPQWRCAARARRFADGGGLGAESFRPAQPSRQGVPQPRRPVHAAKELQLAKELDPADPTPCLYAALLLRQQLRFNEALGDLEESVARNDNRRV